MYITDNTAKIEIFYERINVSVCFLKRNMATQAWVFVNFLSTQDLEFWNTNESDSETNKRTDI